MLQWRPVLTPICAVLWGSGDHVHQPDRHPRPGTAAARANRSQDRVPEPLRSGASAWVTTRRAGRSTLDDARRLWRGGASPPWLLLSQAREHILKIHSRRMNLMRGINLRSVASKMSNCSGAECKVRSTTVTPCSRRTVGHLYRAEPNAPLTRCANAGAGCVHGGRHVCPSRAPHPRHTGGLRDGGGEGDEEGRREGHEHAQVVEVGGRAASRRGRWRRTKIAGFLSKHAKNAEARVSPLLVLDFSL